MPETSVIPQIDQEKLGDLYVGPPLIKKALLFSLWDGLLANGMVALLETFAIAAAVSLHAPSMAIALLSCLPILLGSFGQFLLPGLIDPHKGRKHYVMLGCRLQSLFLFLAAFTGWLPQPLAVWIYVLIFVLAGLSGNAPSGLWVAWMGDLVPSSIRGRHFAWRNVFFAWMHLSCSLMAGIFARQYTSQNAPWSLFCLVFIVAAFFRFVSFLFMSRQYEPISSQPIRRVSPFQFRPRDEFLAYCLPTALFQGAVSLSGPFFNVWFLRDLGFNYLTFSVATSCTVLGTICFLPFWGKFADHFGTKRVLNICGLMVAFIPLPYIWINDPWIISAFNFFSGVAWSGYNLGNFNYLLNATEKSDRTQHIAFASACTGISIFIFTMLGGFLATRLPMIFVWPLQSLFLFSFILRIGIFTAFFGRFKECEERLPGPSLEAFHAIPGYRSGMGLLRNVFRAFRSQ